MTIKKIGILTGGGDCPGLNSVIYGIMLKAFDAGVECIGIQKGWKGFLDNITVPLDIAVAAFAIPGIIGVIGVRVYICICIQICFIIHHINSVGLIRQVL